MIMSKAMVVECRMSEQEATALYCFLQIFDKHVDRMMEEGDYTQGKADELHETAKTFSRELLRIDEDDCD